MPNQKSAANLLLTTFKPRFSARESVSLSLRFTNAFGEPLTINGSVAVTDAEQAPFDTVKHLITTALPAQGWRSFLTANPDSLAGTTSLELRGQVFDDKNKLLPKANLLVTFGGRTTPDFARSTRTDASGRFVVTDLSIHDTVQVRIRVMNVTFKTLPARVVLDKPERVFRHNTSGDTTHLDRFTTYIAAMRQRQAIGQYRDQTARQLNEVIVKATKPVERTAPEQFKLYGEADARVVFDEVSRSFANVYEMIRGRLAGVSVQNKQSGSVQTGYKVIVRGPTTFGNNNPIYIVDGMAIEENEDGTALFMFNPNDVERIELLKNGGSAIYGARAGAGVIAIFLRKSSLSTEKQGKEIATSMLGYTTPYEFTIPRYTTSSSETQPHADQRDVIYWQPLLTSDTNGQSLVRFPLTDVVRRLRITVQGVTATGESVFVQKELTVRDYDK